jgi:hypothetical protein
MLAHDQREAGATVLQLTDADPRRPTLRGEALLSGCKQRKLELDLTEPIRVASIMEQLNLAMTALGYCSPAEPGMSISTRTVMFRAQSLVSSFAFYFSKVSWPLPSMTRLTDDPAPPVGIGYPLCPTRSVATAGDAVLGLNVRSRCT